MKNYAFSKNKFFFGSIIKKNARQINMYRASYYISIYKFQNI